MPRDLLSFVVAFCAFFAVGTPLFAQLDPDPNSPQPFLLTQKENIRVLAEPDGPRMNPKGISDRETVFEPGSRVILYAANFQFMAGEAANSLRVYAANTQGHKYRFPVLDVVELKEPAGVFAVTIELKDEIGYWPTPDRGDLLINLTWRGLVTNPALIGYGATGGWDEGGDIISVPLSSIRKSKAKRSSRAGLSKSLDYVGYRWSSDRMRFLQQATFGANQALDFQVRREGLRTYLARQFSAPYPSAANPYPNIPLKNTDANNTTNGCGMFATNTQEYRFCIRDHYSMYPIQTWFFREAFYGEPQLRHKIAWALSQIWVISGLDTQQSSWMIAYHKKLSDNAFGNYRQLMEDITFNPGMGNYLDMMRSTRTNPNENYPREILQLFTVGLFMLNQDGTLQRDALNNPIPTYTQNDINNFTKVFTGWRDCRTADFQSACPNALPGIPDYKDPMSLNTNNHDLTAKTLLSYPGVTTQNVVACTGCTQSQIYTYAYNSVDQTLDNIFNHPNVAPFVSKLLIQHLVMSDPTPAYVGRVAAVFNNNGQGVRGDMKSVIRAILLDPEARGDIKSDPNYGKLREPVQLMTNLMKAFEVKSFSLAANSDGAVHDLASSMAQNPFNSPTVFNYYSPDFVIPGTTLLGPEFGIMTTGTAIARANFANTMVYTGRDTSNENRPLGTALDLAEVTALATSDPTGNRVLDIINQRMMNNRMSAEMRSTILPAFTFGTTTTPVNRARAAIYLAATSSQFQVQR